MKHKPRKDACTNVIDRGPYRRKTVRWIMDNDPGYAADQMRSRGPTVTDRIHFRWFREAMLHEQLGTHDLDALIGELAPSDFGPVNDLLHELEEASASTRERGMAGDHEGALTFDPVRSFRRD